MARVRGAFLFISCILLAGCSEAPPPRPADAQFPPMPAGIDHRLSTYFRAAGGHQRNVWRDTPPLNPDGTVNGYVEIPRGESMKWEFRIELNRRDVDRTIPPELGGYPINYGFLPQTISYDGDPADVLVLGPPAAGGELVKGTIVALMEMIDAGDLDSKVVISPLDADGRATHALEPGDRERLERFFNTYKNHDGKVTRITGWGNAERALAFLKHTAAFFNSGKSN
jgi:inorganic pyrophosphatase